jgi:hypothetical protein
MSTAMARYAPVLHAVLPRALLRAGKPDLPVHGQCGFQLGEGAQGRRKGATLALIDKLSRGTRDGAQRLVLVLVLLSPYVIGHVTRH